MISTSVGGHWPGQPFVSSLSWDEWLALGRRLLVHIGLSLDGPFLFNMGYVSGIVTSTGC